VGLSFGRQQALEGGRKAWQATVAHWWAALVRRVASAEGGADGIGSAVCGGEKPGRAGGAADAGDRSGAGGCGPKDGGGDLRDGQADAARLGAPVQRRGTGGACEPEGQAAAAAARRGPGGGAGRVGGRRSRPGDGRGGTAGGGRSCEPGSRIGSGSSSTSGRSASIWRRSATGVSRCVPGIRRPIRRPKRLSKTYGPPRLQADFFDAAVSVCANVSGIGALLPAQMELRASRSSQNSRRLGAIF
jgi:hypothetical protein